jgi:hypothetical protein
MANWVAFRPLDWFCCLTTCACHLAPLGREWQQPEIW